jgi:predicted ribosomally synthesized peptide with SipW-like signal peptide
MQTKGKIAASAVSLLTVLGAGAYGTFSAFTDTESNAGNSFAAGTLNIADNDADTALFTVSNLRPGDLMTRCITITNPGTLIADKLDITATSSGGTNNADTPQTAVGNLRPALDLDVQQIVAPADGTAGACSGAALATNGFSFSREGMPDTFDVGTDGADLAGVTGSRSYRIKVTFDENVNLAAPTEAQVNKYQSDTAAFAITFKASSKTGTDRPANNGVEPN